MRARARVRATRWRRATDDPRRRGGNGEVFRVTDTTGEYARAPAQKFLRLDHFNKYERFQREVEIAERHEHANLSVVLAHNLPKEPTEADRPFFVMPWYDGGTLRDHLRRGDYANRPELALRTILPVLGAVRYLH